NIVLPEIIPRLIADCNNVICICAGVPELLRVNFHIYCGILIGVALMYQLVHGNDRFDAGPLNANRYLVAEPVIQGDAISLQILLYPTAAPGGREETINRR